MSETDAYLRGVAAGEAKAVLRGALNEATAEVEKLRAENERLKAELARLRGLPRLGALEAENERLRAVLPFFRSVILSGESWTDVCEQRYREAMGEG